jgi:WD40 repeat protein
MSLGTRFVLACLLGLGAVAAAEAAAPPVRRLDAYGDHLPRGAVARLGTVRWRHDGVSAFAFTRTGETLVSVGARAVQFWDAKTGKVVRSFPVVNGFDPGQLSMPVVGDVVVAGTSDKVVAYNTKSGKELWRVEGAGPESAAITSDGSTVAVGMGTGAIKIHEAKTGKLLRTIDSGKTSISHMEFSADGRTLLAVEAKRLNQWQFDSSVTLHVWDVKAGKQLREWKEKFCLTASLSPDGKTVAYDSECTVQLCEVASGKPLPKLKERPKVLTGGTQLLRTAFSPDGALALGYGNRTEVWDIRKVKLVREIWAEAHHMAFSRDGQILVINSGWKFGQWAHLSLIDLKTGKRAFGLPSVPASIRELAVSGDGKHVAAVTFQGETLLWDSRTGQQVGRLRPPKRDVHHWQVRFLRDGTSLAGVGIRTIEKGGGDRHHVVLWSWDFRRGRELWPEQSLGEKGRWYSFDPRGVLFAYRTESNVNVRNLRTCKLWREVPLEKDYRGRAMLVSNVFFAPDGNTLAVNQDVDSINRLVNLWDLKLNKAVGKVKAKSSVYAGVFGFGIHGRRLLSGTNRAGEWRTWDLWGAGVRTLELPKDAGTATVSPNGLWIAETNREDVKIIELTTGRAVLTWRGDPTSPTACAWMPDGKRLVVGFRPPLVLNLALCADVPKAAALAGEKRRVAIWADLKSKDGAAAFRAVCWLAKRPDEALPLLEKYLMPAPGPDRAAIRKLIAQLDDDNLDTREGAEGKLKTLGSPAKRQLEEIVGNDKASAEQCRRARRLLEAIKVPAMDDERLPEEVAKLRALQVLEWIDSPRARKHLKALGEGDPDVALTRYARSAQGLRK